MKKMSMVLLSAAFSQDWVADPESDFEVSLNNASDGYIIRKYTGSDRDVVIPAEIQGFPVREISDRAFLGCGSLDSVAIPDSVTKIGAYAFMDCSNLASIAIPDSVTEIGKQAFMGCIRLFSVAIPDGVTEISEGTFMDCIRLVSVAIPDSVTEIGAGAFSRCCSLIRLTIEPVKRKWMCNFSDCKLNFISQAVLRKAGYTGRF
ncbi:MAG: leucine-rich repeat domain-containing protein [Treponema sp.]|nr:leucine-rich repeat domain-containing protein [Treponema sp.]